MSHSPAESITYNGEPVTGHINQLFDDPSPIFEGVDAPARFTTGLLFCEGTDARKIFDKAHEVTLGVVFKIYTNNVVGLAAMPPSVPSGRRTSGSKAKVVDSKTFNNGDPLEFKICLFGESLNDLKDLCANLCEQYAPLMKHLLLTSKLAPQLNWKGVVGRTKIVLAGHEGWFEFVDLLEKSKMKKGSIMILNENEDLKAKKNAQVSAANLLIVSAAGPEPGSQEIEVANARVAAAEKLVRLHKTTAKIYHQHAKQATGGDGVVLTAPWDRTFHYWLTLRGASVWAQAIEDKITTIHMAPDIPAYREEMEKSRVFHRAMRVEGRVQQHLAACRSARSTRSFFAKHPNTPTPSGGKAKCLVISDSQPERKLKPLAKKESLKRDKNPRTTTGTNLDIQLMPKLEPKPHCPKTQYAKGISRGNNIWIDEDIPSSDTSDTSDGIQVKVSHEAALENFLHLCGVAPEDLNTRMGLADAGVESWTDLIPSLQMTEGHLVMQGIDRNVAGRLLARAQNRHWKRMNSEEV